MIIRNLLISIFLLNSDIYFKPNYDYLFKNQIYISWNIILLHYTIDVNHFPFLDFSAFPFTFFTTLLFGLVGTFLIFAIAFDAFTAAFGVVFGYGFFIFLLLVDFEISYLLTSTYGFF